MELGVELELDNNHYIFTCISGANKSLMVVGTSAVSIVHMS